jgi:hypothetical protein
MVPVAAIGVPETVVHAGEPAVEAAAVKSAKSSGMETVPMEAAAVKSTKSPGMETAAMKPAPVKPAKAAAMESTATVETPASAVRCGVGEVRLTEHSGEQQRSCDPCQSPSWSGPGSILGYSILG